MRSRVRDLDSLSESMRHRADEGPHHQVSANPQVVRLFGCIRSLDFNNQKGLFEFIAEFNHSPFRPMFVDVKKESKAESSKTKPKAKSQKPSVYVYPADADDAGPEPVDDDIKVAEKSIRRAPGSTAAFPSSF